MGRYRRVYVLGSFGIDGREIGFLDNPIANAGLTTRVSMAFVLIGRPFRETVRTTPESARSHFLLGSELLEQERFGESI